MQRSCKKELKTEIQTNFLSYIKRSSFCGALSNYFQPLFCEFFLKDPYVSKSGKLFRTVFGLLLLKCIPIIQQLTARWEQAAAAASAKWLNIDSSLTERRSFAKKATTTLSGGQKSNLVGYQTHTETTSLLLTQAQKGAYHHDMVQKCQHYRVVPQTNNSKQNPKGVSVLLAAQCREKTVLLATLNERNTGCDTPGRR